MHAGFILPTALLPARGTALSVISGRPQRRMPTTPRRTHGSRSRWSCAAADSPPPPGSGADDDTEHDIPNSSVDWNGEWSKFQAGGMRSMAPEGREPVSKEALAAQKAVGTLRSTVNRVGNSVPSRQKLFADWRFWVAIILSLSLFSAFVQSSQTAVSGYGSI